MNSWNGSSESRLVSSWGPPDRTYKASDGNTVLSWISDGVEGKQCVKNFNINGKGRIVHWSFRGCDANLGKKEVASKKDKLKKTPILE